MKFNRVWLVYLLLAVIVAVAGSAQKPRTSQHGELIWVLDPKIPLTVVSPIMDERTLSVVTHIDVNVRYSPFTMEKLVGGVWKPIPYEPKSNFVEAYLASAWYTKRFNITGLDSGTYRVGMNVNFSAAWIEFKVNRPDQSPDTRPYGFRPIYFYENRQDGLQTLELANLGTRTLLIGSGYELERKTDAGWVTEESVADAGPPLEVESWGIYRQSFQLPVGEGEYRYVKDVGVENSSWVETLAFAYVEGPSQIVYIWDPDPNLRSREYSESINSGPYAPGDQIPISVQHLGGNDDKHVISFSFELIDAKNMAVVGRGAVDSLPTYLSWKTTIDVPLNAVTGTYYIKLIASEGQETFSTITKVVEMVEFKDLQLSPEIRVAKDPPGSRIFYLSVENGSPRSIIRGAYTLEKRVNGVWVSYPRDDVSKDWETTVDEQDWWFRRYDFSGLEAGDYRFVIPISYTGGEPQMFYAEFKA